MSDQDSINAEYTAMAESVSKKLRLSDSSSLEGVVTMPWDVDRWRGRNAYRPKENVPAEFQTTTDPSFPSRVPSRLLTLPLDILIIILTFLAKTDIFQLAHTCKRLMRDPGIMKALFFEIIRIRDLMLWYRDLPFRGPHKFRGPSVTWGINKLTGYYVNRMALPEWTTEKEILFLIAYCPNLHTIDFTEFFKTVPQRYRSIWSSNTNADEYDDGDDEDDQDRLYRFWPPWFHQCPGIFYPLTSMRIPYGWRRGLYSLPHGRYRFNLMAELPENLSMAKHLQILTISCQSLSTRNTSPEARRKASSTLQTGILNMVSKQLKTLALQDSVVNIDNLDRFLQPLAVFPKLRTIELSLYTDVYNYQKELHSGNSLSSIVEPILSDRTGKYEHDTASTLQYLSVIKTIKERGRFSVVPIDKDTGGHYLPCNFYGLSQTELIPGPANNSWTPLWLWNDRMPWIASHRSEHPVEVVDIVKCRALFNELIKAHIPVSLELGPQLFSSDGSPFSHPWVDQIVYRYYDKDGNVHDENMAYSPRRRSSRNTCDASQHFKGRDLPRRTSRPPPTEDYYWSAQLPEVHLASIFQTPPPHRPLTLNPLSQHPPTRPSQPAREDEKPQTSEVHPDLRFNPEGDLPNPVWRLDQIGNLVDDLRWVITPDFVTVYIDEFTKHRRGDLCDPRSDAFLLLRFKCETHLRHRLWRESEYTALLLRRIKVDFPRLTRFALSVPAALYPDSDQTIIERVLPGTGWSVRHHEKKGELIGRDWSSPMYMDDERMWLAQRLCPFVKRIFTREEVTEDSKKRVLHDSECSVMKRPVVDLDEEYKTMEELLREPLEMNYVINR